MEIRGWLVSFQMALRSTWLVLAAIFSKDHLSKAVKLNPSLADAWLCLGNCIWKKEDLTAAHNYLRLALDKVISTSKELIDLLKVEQPQDIWGHVMNVIVAIAEVLAAVVALAGLFGSGDDNNDGGGDGNADGDSCGGADGGGCGGIDGDCGGASGDGSGRVSAGGRDRGRGRGRGGDDVSGEKLVVVEAMLVVMVVVAAVMGGSCGSGDGGGDAGGRGNCGSGDGGSGAGGGGGGGGGGGCGVGSSSNGGGDMVVTMAVVVVVAKKAIKRSVDLQRGSAGESGSASGKVDLLRGASICERHCRSRRGSVGSPSECGVVVERGVAVERGSPSVPSSAEGAGFARWGWVWKKVRRRGRGGPCGEAEGPRRAARNDGAEIGGEMTQMAQIDVEKARTIDADVKKG
ncbi:hypothetical protein E2542_SST14881 [Spatholobus suberectus]|nr:hypothetical protein E2542_SST14881 [Spatholobus suberectus]